MRIVLGVKTTANNFTKFNVDTKQQHSSLYGYGVLFFDVQVYYLCLSHFILFFFTIAGILNFELRFFWNILYIYLRNLRYGK